MQKESVFYKKIPGQPGRITGGYIWLAVKRCESCGAEFSSGNTAASKYCPDCAKRIRTEQNRERQRRYRERHKGVLTNDN